MPINPEMEDLDRKVGGPVASYTLDDLRRMFLRGQAAPVAMPGAMPANVEAMIPTPITDALRGPPMPSPVASAPLPRPSEIPPSALAAFAPRRPVMPPPAAPSGSTGNDALPPPVPLANPDRVDPRALARMLMRMAPPTGAEVPLSPGAEMQVGPAPLKGMPIEAQADQRMSSVSRVNPQSFGQRFRRTMRGE